MVSLLHRNYHVSKTEAKIFKFNYIITLNLLIIELNNALNTHTHIHVCACACVCVYKSGVLKYSLNNSYLFVNILLYFDVVILIQY